jgi:hypothetical protein
LVSTVNDAQCSTAKRSGGTPITRISELVSALITLGTTVQRITRINELVSVTNDALYNSLSTVQRILLLSELI